MELPHDIKKIIDKEISNGYGPFSFQISRGASNYTITGKTEREQHQTSPATHYTPAEYHVYVNVHIDNAEQWEDESGELIRDYTEAANEYAKEESRNNSDY